MKRAAIPIHTRLASFLALVTVLAFLTAPLCAPLCAGKICASAMTSSGPRHESCHEMANMPPTDDDYYLASNKSCGAATDFSAVLVTADDQSSLLQAARFSSTPARIDPSLARELNSFRATHKRWAVHRVPLESNDFLPLATSLRI